jgi:hypothetical protein
MHRQSSARRDRPIRARTPHPLTCRANRSGQRSRSRYTVDRCFVRKPAAEPCPTAWAFFVRCCGRDSGAAGRRGRRTPSGERRQPRRRPMPLRLQVHTSTVSTTDTTLTGQLSQVSLKIWRVPPRTPGFRGSGARPTELTAQTVPICRYFYEQQTIYSLPMAAGTRTGTRSLSGASGAVGLVRVRDGARRRPDRLGGWSAPFAI